MYLMRIERYGSETPAARVDNHHYVDPSNVVADLIDTDTPRAGAAR